MFDTDTQPAPPSDSLIALHQPWQLWLGPEQVAALAGVSVPDDVTDSGGLRLSTDCPCRRLREHFAEGVEPNLYHAFPESLDARGHGFEVILAANLAAEGHTFWREVAVPWGHGDTHIDFVVIDGPRMEVWSPDGAPVVIEVKANKDAEHKSENRRQTERQERVVERAVADRLAGHGWSHSKQHTFHPAALLPGVAKWISLVIDPATWRIPKPDGHRIELSDERRAAIDAELAEVDQYVADAASYNLASELHDPMSWPDCTCTCWPTPLFELPNLIAEKAFAYHEAHEGESVGKAEKKVLKPQIVADLERLHGAGKLPGKRFVGGGFEVLITKDGKLKVKEATA